MTQEEKELLLKDLVARLPYGVKVQGNFRWGFDGQIMDDMREGVLDIETLEWLMNGIEVRPYLRPMSSMTEEERKEIGILIREKRPNPYGIINNEGVDNLLLSVSVTSTVLIDWLNKHHFDYRGLIEKGLAIAVTEENNPYKE